MDSRVDECDDISEETDHRFTSASEEPNFENIVYEHTNGAFEGNELENVCDAYEEEVGCPNETFEETENEFLSEESQKTDSFKSTYLDSYDCNDNIVKDLCEKVSQSCDTSSVQSVEKLDNIGRILENSQGEIQPVGEVEIINENGQTSIGAVLQLIPEIPVTNNNSLFFETP